MNHAHPLDLFGSEEAKLDLLDGAQGRLGVGEVDVRHGDGWRRVEALLGKVAGGSVDEDSARKSDLQAVLDA